MAKRREVTTGMSRRNGSDVHSLIELRDVHKTYQTGAGETTVLRAIDLQVRPGEFVSVVGPSGSGKSTMLNMITGMR